MNFGEMFKTQLNAMVYARCMWNMEGKNPMQLIKAHLTIFSAASKARYDVCVYESNTLPFDQVKIPEMNGKKMFELDRDTYAKIEGGHFFFLQIVSGNQPMVPNFVFTALEEAQRFALEYKNDTRGLDVMFKHLDPQAAAKMAAQPAFVPSAPNPSQPAPEEREQAGKEGEEPAAEEERFSGKAEQEAAPSGKIAEEQNTPPPRMMQSPVNMYAYDRFYLDLTGIDKRSLVRFYYSFVSPVTKAGYDVYVLQSRSKPYGDVTLPQRDGKPVVEINEEAYNSIKDKDFCFVEVISGGQTLVPNLMFEAVDDAKKYLYNYKMDTRGLDVMFKKLTPEEAGKLGRQPSIEREAEPQREEDVPHVQPEEKEAAEAAESAEEVKTPDHTGKTEELPAAATQPAESAVESVAAGVDNEPEEVETAAEENVLPDPEINPAAEQKTERTEEAAVLTQPLTGLFNEPVAPAAEQDPRQESPTGERTHVSRTEAVTPPVSMAVYSRFCLDLTDISKEELIRHTACFASTYSDTRYEVNVYLGKSLQYDEVRIPEINRKRLFDLPREDYEKLCSMRFYFIEVTSEGQTTVLNKIFSDLETAERYVAMYEEDIRELDVMFRRITPLEAARGGSVQGKPYEKEEAAPAREEPETAAARKPEPEQEEKSASDEDFFDEESIETKTYVDENGDEVEEQTVVRTRTLFEDEDEEAEGEEYADEEYADEEYEEEAEEYAEEDEDVEFVDENEEYAEEDDQFAEGDEAYCEEEYAAGVTDAEDVSEPGCTDNATGSAAGKEQDAATHKSADRINIDRKAAPDGSVIYNQPIYAKEVFIQFPQGVTAMSSPLNAGYAGDVLSDMNYRGEFNEVDFKRYMEQVERFAYGGEFAGGGADDGDFIVDGLFAQAEREDGDLTFEDLFGCENDYEDYFGLREKSDDLEDIFGDLLHDKRPRTARDDYDDIMKMFRTQADDTNFKNII